MLKTLSILLVCLLIFCPLVSAEQQEIISGIVDGFSFRNGIKFLMTKEEVQAREELTTTYQKYSVYDNNLQINGTLAGIDNAIGYYVFDDDSLLKSFEYSFGGNMFDLKPRAKIKSEYDSVENTFSDKYGDALISRCPIISEYLIGDIESLDDLGKVFGVLNFSERLLKNKNGGYVKIEHWSTYKIVDNSDIEITNHNVQYTYYSDEYVNLVIAEIESKEAQKDSDL